MRGKIGRYFGAFCIIIVAWYVIHRITGLPQPLEVVLSIDRAGSELGSSFVASLVRIIGGFTIACVIGIPLGMFVGLSKTTEDFMDPIIKVLTPIAPVAWIPLAILWFGVSTTQVLFIIFITAFFPIVLNTISGVKNIDQTLVNAARSLGANRKTMWAEVILPGALPGVLVGCRIGFGFSWGSIVAAELVGGSIRAGTGIGYMMWRYGTYLLDERILILSMMVIGLGHFTFDRLILLLITRLTPWQRELEVRA